MRKPKSTKLVLRRDTVRALAEAELARAVGGDSDAVCTGAHVLPPPPKG
jgi:hypothetical protein